MRQTAFNLSRRACALLLALAMITSFTMASAATESKYTPYAQSLSDLGVFKGTGNGFDLDRTPTRAEGVTMLVRLMGAESDAAAMAQTELPFTDVPNWAHGYVAYAWENKLSNGTGATTFGSDGYIDAKMFTTLLLRALGYRDAEGDFQYAQAVSFAQSVGLWDEAFSKEIQNGTFLRGHVARMCYEALRFPVKGTEVMLVEKLVADGKLEGKLVNAFLANVITPESAGAPADPGTTPTPTDPPAKEMTTTELASKTLGSIVLLTCTVPEGTSQGSGVILSADGTIVTNFHVVEGASKISVTFNDKTVYDGTVVIQDYDVVKDLAVLKINKTGLAPVTLGDSDALVVGEKVVAIGSPYGYSNTVSEGIISAIRDKELQTTAPISHGSSGGALFNTKGELVGITYAGVDVAQNLGFAIPVNMVKTLTAKKGLSLADFGKGTTVEQPKNLRLIKEDDTSVYLQFDPVQGADYYYFYYSKASDDSFTWDDDSSGNQIKYTYKNDWSIQFSGLVKGVKYEVCVTAVKNGIESDYRQSFTFTKSGSPNANTGANGVKFYADASWCPDFGALTGNALDYGTSDDGTYMYIYSSYDDADIKLYEKTLEECGITYDAAETARAANELTVVSGARVFSNIKSGIEVITGYDKYGDYLVATYLFA